MSENKTRRWPVSRDRQNYLSPEQAKRAEELFDKYDETMDIKYSGLSEDDATLYVVWVSGLHPNEARWLVRANRGEEVRYDSTFGFPDPPDKN